jgi:cell wall assembly regulator SMI1
MSDLIERLDRWLAENRPDYYSGLQPGISEEEVVALEAKLGVALPTGLRNLLKWHNGQAPKNYDSIYHNYSLIDAEEIAGIRESNNELLAAGDFDQPNWWDPQWIPFLGNGGGDNYCVDLAGSFGGTKGQIIVWNHDYEARPVEHVDFEHWLQTLVEALERGYLVDDDPYGMQPTEEFDDLYKEINPGYPIDNEAG